MAREVSNPNSLFPIVGFDKTVSSAITRALKRCFPGSAPPAATSVGVTALAHPDLRVEIEATAVTK
ncbi:MAG: hypothetical protein CMO26_01815 [Thiotrichales bacterium]|nr:hypothetical protein [Thiotrichales bacterium]|tara:strand:- start:759 stop:956 length:198 start_codon:yes stop_codon:yes gene_type:complete